MAATELYETDATFVSGGTAVSGHEAIRAAMDGFAAMKPDIAMNITRVIQAGDIAVMLNEWSAPAGEGGTPAMSGKALEVARRQADGSWKYVIDDPNAFS